MRQSAISDLENGKKGSGIYDLYRLQQLADRVGVKLQYLVFGEGDSTTPSYAGQSESLELIEKTNAIKKSHRDRLTTLMGQWDPTRVTGFEYRTWRVYLVDEIATQHRLGLRTHVTVFFEDRIIAAMTTSIMKLGDCLVQSEALTPQGRLPLSMITKRLDPFTRLLAISGEDDRHRFEVLAKRRSQLIETRQESLVVVIEAIDVDEDYRQRGLCRMMVDALSRIAPSANVWLDLRPSRSSILMQDRLADPTETISQLGQMNLNASIAERLGFRIDEETSEVKVSVEEDCTTTINTHVWAYRLNDDFQAITAEDGLFRELMLTQERLAALELTTKAEIEEEQNHG